MFDVVAAMLRELFGKRIPAFATDQVGFVVPDKDWRQSVGANPLLNVYLVEIIENTLLRSNEVVRETVGNAIVDRRRPVRLDCRYFISAWSPQTAGVPFSEPAIDEHVLLYQAAKALFDVTELDANEIYAPAVLPVGFPDALLDPCPPIRVAQPPGSPRIADFWARMDAVYKPVVELVVTLPVVAVERPAGPPVTTMTARYMRMIAPGLGSPMEQRVVIGGVVRAGGMPLSGAWVRVVALPGMVWTNDAGQFVLDVAKGDVTLEAGAPGYGAVSRQVTVPSPTGEYDLTL